MNLQVDIQTACAEPVPDEDDICSWIAAALSNHRKDAEVSLRFVSEAEMADLNQRYRDKSGSTNVLSFPADLPAGVELPLLGDIVACPAVVEREARAQDKTLQAHWAHMMVHGSLHLLGYDHIESAEADIMESMETDILQSLGYSDPYTAAESETKSAAPMESVS